MGVVSCYPRGAAGGAAGLVLGSEPRNMKRSMEAVHVPLAVSAVAQVVRSAMDYAGWCDELCCAAGSGSCVTRSYVQGAGGGGGGHCQSLAGQAGRPAAALQSFCAL